MHSLTVEMLSHGAWLRQEVPRRAGLLRLVADLDTALRTLEAMREELACLDTVSGSSWSPPAGRERTAA